MIGELQIAARFKSSTATGNSTSVTLRCGVFIEPGAGFAAVVGDYAALPRVYRLEDDAWGVAGLNVVGFVWAEFIYCDPWQEARRAAACGFAGMTCGCSHARKDQRRGPGGRRVRREGSRGRFAQKAGRSSVTTRSICWSRRRS
jgi:hypothetical protein